MMQKDNLGQDIFLIGWATTTSQLFEPDPFPDPPDPWDGG